MSENVNFFKLQHILDQISPFEGEVENLTNKEIQMLKDMGISEEQINTLGVGTNYKSFMKKIGAESAAEREKVMEELGKILNELAEIYGSDKAGLRFKISQIFGRAAGDDNIKTLEDVVKFFREEVAEIKNGKAGLNEDEPKAKLEKMLAKYMSYEYTTESDEEELIKLLDKLEIKYKVGKETVKDKDGNDITCKTLQFEYDGKKYSFQTNRAVTSGALGGLGGNNGANIAPKINNEIQQAGTVGDIELQKVGAIDDDPTDKAPGADDDDFDDSNFTITSLDQVNTIEDFKEYLEYVKSEIKKGNLAPLNDLLAHREEIGFIVAMDRVADGKYKYDITYQLGQEADWVEFEISPEDLEKYPGIKTYVDQADFYYIQDQITDALKNCDKDTIEKLRANGVEIVITKIETNTAGQDYCRVSVSYKGLSETITVFVKNDDVKKNFGNIIGYTKEEIAGYEEYFKLDKESGLYILDKEKTGASSFEALKAGSVEDSGAVDEENDVDVDAVLAAWIDKHPEGSVITDEILNDLKSQLGTAGFNQISLVHKVAKRKGFDDEPVIVIKLLGAEYVYVDQTKDAKQVNQKDGEQKVRELIEEFVSGNLTIREFVDGLGKTGLVDISDYNKIPSANWDFSRSDLNNNIWDFTFKDINGNTYHIKLNKLRDKTSNSEKDDILMFTAQELSEVDPALVAKYFDITCSRNGNALTYTLKSDANIPGITSNSTKAEILAALGVSGTEQSSDEDEEGVTVSEINAALNALDGPSGSVAKLKELAKKPGVTVTKEKVGTNSYKVTVKVGDKTYTKTITNPSAEVRNYLDADSNTILDIIKQFTSGNITITEFIAALGETSLVDTKDYNKLPNATWDWSRSSLKDNVWDFTFKDINGNTYSVILKDLRDKTDVGEGGTQVKDDIFTGTTDELKKAGFTEEDIKELFYCSVKFGDEEVFYTLDLSKLPEEIKAQIKPGMSLKQIADAVHKKFDEFKKAAVFDSDGKELVEGYKANGVFGTNNFVSRLTNLIKNSGARDAVKTVLGIELTDEQWNSLVASAVDKMIDFIGEHKDAKIQDVINACLKLIFDNAKEQKAKPAKADTEDAQDLIDELNKDNKLADEIKKRSVGDGKTYDYNKDKFADIRNGINDIEDEISDTLKNIKDILLAAIKNKYKDTDPKVLEDLFKDNYDAWIAAYMEEYGFGNITDAANAPTVKDVVDGFIAFVNKQVINTRVSGDSQVQELAEALVTKTVDDVDSKLKDKPINLKAGDKNGKVDDNGLLKFEDNKLLQDVYDGLHQYVKSLIGADILAKLGGEEGFNKLFNEVWKAVMGLYKDNVVNTDTFIKDFMATLAHTLQDEKEVQNGINGKSVTGVKAKAADEPEGEEEPPVDPNSPEQKTVTGDSKTVLVQLIGDRYKNDSTQYTTANISTRINEVLSELKEIIKAIFISAGGKESDFEKFFSNSSDCLVARVQTSNKKAGIDKPWTNADSYTIEDIISAIYDSLKAALVAAGLKSDGLSVNYYVDDKGNVSLEAPATEAGNGGGKSADGTYLGAGYDNDPVNSGMSAADRDKYFVKGEDGKWYINLNAVAELFPDEQDLTKITLDDIKDKLANNSLDPSGIIDKYSEEETTEEINTNWSQEQAKEAAIAKLKALINITAFKNKLLEYIKAIFGCDMSQKIDDIIEELLKDNSILSQLNVEKGKYSFDTKKVIDTFIELFKAYVSNNNPNTKGYNSQQLSDNGLSEFKYLFNTNSEGEYVLNRELVSKTFSEYESKYGPITTLEDLHKAIEYNKGKACADLAGKVPSNFTDLHNTYHDSAFKGTDRMWGGFRIANGKIFLDDDKAKKVYADLVKDIKSKLGSDSGLTDNEIEMLIQAAWIAQYNNTMAGTHNMNIDKFVEGVLTNLKKILNAIGNNPDLLQVYTMGTTFGDGDSSVTEGVSWADNTNDGEIRYDQTHPSTGERLYKSEDGDILCLYGDDGDKYNTLMRGLLGNLIKRYCPPNGPLSETKIKDIFKKAQEAAIATMSNNYADLPGNTANGIDRTNSNNSSREGDGFRCSGEDIAQLTLYYFDKFLYADLAGLTYGVPTKSY